MEPDSLPYSEHPFRQCMQAAMAASITGGSALAERAVDEFVAAHDGPDQQMGALRVLEEELISLLRSTSGEHFSTANSLIDFVDARMRALRLSQRR
jgi:hypothetical protein